MWIHVDLFNQYLKKNINQKFPFFYKTKDRDLNIFIFRKFFFYYKYKQNNGMKRCDCAINVLATSGHSRPGSEVEVVFYV